MTIPYYLPYCILLLILFLLAYIEHKQAANLRVWPRVVAFMVMLFFFGLRGLIMEDWVNYYVHFENCNTIQDVIYHLYGDGGGNSIEIGYSFFVYSFKQIWDNYFAFQFFCSFINLCLLFRFFSRYITNYSFGCALFLIFGGVALMINLIRNSIVILLFLNMLPLIKERKFILYMVGCAIAMTIHVSALLFIPLYFVLNCSLSHRTYIIIMASAFIFFFIRGEWFTNIILQMSSLLGERIMTKMESYLLNQDMAYASRFSIGFIERLLLAVLVCVFYDSLKQKYEGATMFINMFLLYVCFNCFMSNYHELADRSGILFIGSCWSLWSYMPKMFEIRSNKIFCYISIFVVAMSKMCILTNKTIAQYENVLFHHSSYDERYDILIDYQNQLML